MRPAFMATGLAPNTQNALLKTTTFEERFERLDDVSG